MLANDASHHLYSLWQQHKRALPPPSNVSDYFTPNCSIAYVPIGALFQGHIQIGQLMEQLRSSIYLIESEIVFSTNTDLATQTVVEESLVKLQHGKRIDWFLPGVKPTDKEISVTFVTIATFEGDKLSSKRIYWDQATVLRQLNILASSIYSRSMGSDVVLPVVAPELIIKNIQATIKSVEENIVDQENEIVQAKVAPPKKLDFHPTTSSSRPSIRLHNAPGGKSRFTPNTSMQTEQVFGLILFSIILLYYRWESFHLSWYLLRLVPSLIKSIVSTTFQITLTITLNFRSFLIATSIFLLLLYIIVRYGWQGRYNQRRNDQLPSSGQSNDNNLGNLKKGRYPSTPNLSTFGLRPSETGTSGNEKGEFLTAFLSSIKVFGYLERDVFQELAKNLNQVNLKKGDVLFDGDDQDRSFYVVVEGRINLYAVEDRENDEEVDDSSDSTKMTLMNEVKAGGSVSSLFNVLSVLCEDYSVEHPQTEVTSKGEPLFPRLRTSKRTRRKLEASSGLGVLARAECESILVVLPEEAFQELAIKYPSSAAHIVQVILTRFQRVTSMTLQRYLGLNNELCKLERASRVNVEISLDLMQQVLSEFALSKMEDSLCLEESKTTKVPQAMPGKNNSLKAGNLKNDLVNAVLSVFRINKSDAALNIVSPGSEAIGVRRGSLNTDQFVQVLHVPGGALLLQEGERDKGWFLVLHGMLEISFGTSSENFLENTRSSSFFLKSGHLIGLISSVTGHYQLSTIRAKTDSCVLHITRQLTERLVRKFPNIILYLARSLLHHSTSLVRHIDVALEWLNLSAEQTLYKQGDISDAIYIVLHGRLRAIQERLGKEMVVYGEYGLNESLGEVEILTGDSWPSTGNYLSSIIKSVHAIRDTEVVRLPKTLFHFLARRYPEITMQLTRIIAQKKSMPSQPRSELTPISSKVKTVVIIASHFRIPVGEFAASLFSALQKYGKTTLLDYRAVVNSLGAIAFTALGKLRLMNWLAEQEQANELVLFLADTPQAPWASYCLRQADCILLVASAMDDPVVGDVEQLLIGTKTTARRELVLLHETRSIKPGLTRKWLNVRPWIHGHHHICLPSLRNTVSRPDASFQRTIIKFRDRLTGRKQPRQRVLPNSSDFERLARKLTGKCIGLVLGGGGARGCAHVGVIRALEEEGIPIDIVGGVSIGAFVTALYARENDSASITVRLRSFASRMATTWRYFLDLTYPRTSWFTGHDFNRGLWKTMGNIDIEDLWLDYYCTTTNITDSCLEVHRSGLLWRFVRASMSLSGFLPPLSDNGKLLVDGGYLDIIPVDVMRSLGIKHIIAVDVARESNNSPIHYGDTVSGWWLLLKKMLFLHVNVPSLADIQMRLAFVSSVPRLEKVKQTCLYMNACLDSCGTLEFEKCDTMITIGYEYAKAKIAEWKKMDLLKDFQHADKGQKSLDKNRRNSI